MIVGVPKEVKDNEARVGLTPAGAMALVEAGHTVLLETQAGVQSGFPDSDYQNVGAEIVGEAGYVWGKSDLVVKVKEPIEKEYVFFREGRGPERKGAGILSRGAGAVYLSSSCAGR